MNILITGGTGFIGSTITKFFLQQNNYITILSRGRSKVLKPVRVIESINQLLPAQAGSLANACKAD